MALDLSRFQHVELRHPAWRVYKAIQDCQDTPEEVANIDWKETFGLVPPPVYTPFQEIDVLTETLERVMLDKPFVDSTFKINECLSLFMDVAARQPLECCLMNGDAVADIAAELQMDLTFVQTYAGLFFDTSIWRTDADKLAYVRKGTTGQDSVIKKLVLDEGLDYVKTKYFGLPEKLRIDTALLRAFGGAYESLIRGMKSEDLEEQGLALGWSKSMLNIAKYLKSTQRTSGGIKDLIIKLQATEAPTKSIDDLNK